MQSGEASAEAALGIFFEERCAILEVVLELLKASDDPLGTPVLSGNLSFHCYESQLSHRLQSCV